MKPEVLTNRITRLEIPYKDIFTSVYAVKTNCGALLFDAGSYDSDVTEFILPFLNELGITPKDLKYIFISHKHPDHSGGLSALLRAFPNTTVVTRSDKLKEELEGYSVHTPKDGESLLEGLQVIAIPGHTKDSCGLLDTFDQTLISGDSLQMYGIYGSGKWGAAISLPNSHFKALEKLESLDVNRILTAHNYHPMRYDCQGREAVTSVIASCRNALEEIIELIQKHYSLTDSEIADLYTAKGYPTLHERVVIKLREYLNSFETK